MERCYRVSGDNGSFHASSPEAPSGGSVGGSIPKAHAMIPACLPNRPMMSPGQWFPSAPEPGGTNKTARTARRWIEELLRSAACHFVPGVFLGFLFGFLGVSR